MATCPKRQEGPAARIARCGQRIARVRKREAIRTFVKYSACRKTGSLVSRGNETEKSRAMKRCVIVGGAPIERYDRIRAYLNPEKDYYIFCDCGLRHAAELNVTPDLIVGDFDSHARPETSAETIVLPTVKDDTDTVHALNEAMERGYTDYLLIGMTGRRLDHTLGNVYMLVHAFEHGMNALMIDDYSEISVVADKPVEIDDRMPFFSLINIAGRARGIYIEGAKYPLSNAEIKYDYQYGVSNEVLPGQHAVIRVKDGLLLLIRDVEG